MTHRVRRVIRRRARKLTAITAVTVLATGVSVGWAAWTATGTGSSAAVAVAKQTLTVNAATGSADLYPGGPAGAVTFTLTNPNPYTVAFTSATPGPVSGGTTGCDPSNVTAQPASGIYVVAPHGTTTAALSVAGITTMAPSAPDECQGASFTVPLTLTGREAGTWAATNYWGGSSIAATDRLHAFTAGTDALDATSDGGATWHPINTGTYYCAQSGFVGCNSNTYSTASFAGISSPDLMHLWVVGHDENHNHQCFQTGFSNGQPIYQCNNSDYSGGLVRASSDGGKSWSSQLTPAGVDVEAVAMLNSTTGWAVGAQGAIWNTTDGTNWNAQQSPVTGAPTLRAVSFSDPTHGWAAGDNGTIAATTDGGAHWATSTPISGTFTYHSVAALSPSEAWVVGDGGRALHTTNSGYTWSLPNVGTTEALSAVSFVAGGSGWLGGGAGSVLHTLDGGATWFHETTLNGVAALTAADALDAFASDGRFTVTYNPHN